MRGMNATLWVEILKVRRTKVFLISILFFFFIGIMMGLLVFASMHPELLDRSATLRTKSSFLGGANWPSFFNLMLQLILTVGVIGSGIITSWTFGREFADKVIKDLLSLPVSRSAIVTAKIITLFAWSLILSVAALIAAMFTGWLIQLPGWDGATFRSFLNDYLISTILNILLITPVALVAGIGRGYLLPISFVIAIMILTQLVFIGVPSLSIWFPWALPALHIHIAGPVAPSPEPISYILYALTVAGGLAGTMAWWRYADHK